MKNINIHSGFKSFMLLLVAVVMILSMSSCGTTNHFQASSVVPAAEGTVKVKNDNNKNYKVTINVVNLAEPDRLQPPRNTYVIWMEGEDNQTKNIGQIKSSHSMLSKTLKGSFETVTSVKPKKVFITAENDASVQYPDNSNLILTTNYLKN
ncbi:MAG: hypothetical protein ACM3P1_02400 [Candidatus Saccharibacteria bacterium]